MTKFPMDSCPNCFSETFPGWLLLTQEQFGRIKIDNSIEGQSGDDFWLAKLTTADTNEIRELKVAPLRPSIKG